MIKKYLIAGLTTIFLSTSGFSGIGNLWGQDNQGFDCSDQELPQSVIERLSDVGLSDKEISEIKSEAKKAKTLKEARKKASEIMDELKAKDLRDQNGDPVDLKKLQSEITNDILQSLNQDQLSRR